MTEKASSQTNTIDFDQLLRTVLLFGPPGSGKGTQGKFLSSAGNHFHLSSGDIFRGMAPESSEGKLFYQYARQGNLVPDEVTVEIFKHYVHGLIETNRYFPKEQLLLLDGIPRTVPQVAMIEKTIAVQAIIVLETKDVEGLIHRMKRRAVIEGRMDDSEESVLLKRMQIYENETLALLKAYPSHLIHRFNADQKPLQVLKDILIELSDLLS